MSLAFATQTSLSACTTAVSRDRVTHRAHYDFSSYRRMGILPVQWIEALERFFNEGIETGSFLRAVLENDLQGAIKRADIDKPIAVIYALIGLLEEGAPSWAWGSEAKVSAFLDSFTE